MSTPLFVTHFKAIVCDHCLNEFHKKFNKHKVQENKNFECSCTNTYGSHRLFVLICSQCCDNDCICKTNDKHCCIHCVLNLLNYKLLKFCFLYEKYVIMLFFPTIKSLHKYLQYFNTDFKFFYIACKKKVVVTSI